MAQNNIKTFYPTFAEFANFGSFILKCQKHPSSKLGIIKIKPPTGWLAQKNGYDDIFVDSRWIKKPREQKFTKINESWKMDEVLKKNISFKEYKLLYDEQNPREPTTSQKDMESQFWATLDEKKFYGSNFSGTLFDSSLKSTDWNLKYCIGILDLLPKGSKFPGIVTPYLYFGSKNSVFCWHEEDLSLYSINFLHYGAPKSWYVVAAEDYEKFKTLARQQFPTETCSEFLNHKVFLMSPELLLQNDIHCNLVTQFAGEFMVTFPRSFHCGFNQGFNTAEAINFGLPDWVKYLEKAVYCSCPNRETVRLDAAIYDEFVMRYGKRTPTGPRPLSLVCQFCDKFFDNTSLKTKHIQAQHSEKKECQLCHRTFSTQDSLHKHGKICSKLLNKVTG